MRIERIETGPMAVNCYVVYEPGMSACAVIDPGADPELILEAIRANDLTVEYILLTHGHFDHIGALRDVKEASGSILCIHESDADMLTNPAKNLSIYIGAPSVQLPPDRYLSEGEHIQFGGITLIVLHTPGHTPGSVCFMGGGALFTGDTLFAGSVGRTDLPGGEGETLGRSIRDKLLTIEEDAAIYPGHGPATTLIRERLENPYLRQAPPKTSDQSIRDGTDP